MTIQIGDYIEGTELFGPREEPKKIRGWVNKITEVNGVVGYDIRADDSMRGKRGTSIYLKDGEIKKLPFKEYVEPSPYVYSYNPGY